jgi:hypothetical protein
MKKNELPMLYFMSIDGKENQVKIAGKQNPIGRLHTGVLRNESVEERHQGVAAKSHYQ